jgi:flavin reductase (DIM6/NTAB) family NADH-FMN oxidoreductase RutF
MLIDFGRIQPNQRYATVTQTLIPRPVAWLLSENEDNSFNLAPFSYFNAVASDPPLLMVSIGRRPDGSLKDTHRNIERTGHFVIHIPAFSQAEAVNDSSATFPAGESEVDQLKLETCEFPGSPLPRIKNAPVAYACDTFEIQAIGSTPMAMILGEIKQVYIDDSLVTPQENGRIKIDAGKLDPLARLGGIEFAQLGDSLSLDRPG